MDTTLLETRSYVCLPLGSSNMVEPQKELPTFIIEKIVSNSVVDDMGRINTSQEQDYLYNVDYLFNNIRELLKRYHIKKRRSMRLRILVLTILLGTMMVNLSHTSLELFVATIITALVSLFIYRKYIKLKYKQETVLTNLYIDLLKQHASNHIGLKYTCAAIMFKRTSEIVTAEIRSNNELKQQIDELDNINTQLSLIYQDIIQVSSGDVVDKHLDRCSDMGIEVELIDIATPSSLKH